MQRFKAISFDLGQTLVELDHEFLAAQAASRGIALDPNSVTEHTDRAWQAYNLAKAARLSGYDAWSTFARTLLELLCVTRQCTNAPLSAEEREDFVRYLWSEQPHRNLWRKPIAGIRELLQELTAAGIPLAVLTNSEGRAKELVDEVGLGSFIKVVVDSGLEGVEKPDPKLFAILACRLGHAPEDIVHVGDSYEADVLGALGAGMIPVWFTREPTVTLPPNVLFCSAVEELRHLLLPL